jgi:hypothetical protein
MVAKSFICDFYVYNTPVVRFWSYYFSIMFCLEDRTGFRTSPLRPKPTKEPECVTCVYCTKNFYDLQGYFSLKSATSNDDELIFNCYEIEYILKNKNSSIINELKQKLSIQNTCLCYDCVSKHELKLEEILKQCCYCGSKYSHIMCSLISLSSSITMGDILRGGWLVW